MQLRGQNLGTAASSSHTTAPTPGLVWTELGSQGISGNAHQCLECGWSGRRSQRQAGLHSVAVKCVSFRYWSVSASASCDSRVLHHFDLGGHSRYRERSRSGKWDNVADHHLGTTWSPGSGFRRGQTLRRFLVPTVRDGLPTAACSWGSRDSEALRLSPDLRTGRLFRRVEGQPGADHLPPVISVSPPMRWVLPSR